MVKKKILIWWIEKNIQTIIFFFRRYVGLQLETIVKLVGDKVLIVEFLMQRKNSKQILIQVVKDLIMQMPTSLKDIPAIFDKLNTAYRIHLENEIQSVIGTPLQSNAKDNIVLDDNYCKIFLDQSDMYSHILSKFTENTLDSKMIVWILLEYIR